jgi:HEPN domain-containing protein
MLIALDAALRRKVSFHSWIADSPSAIVNRRAFQTLTRDRLADVRALLRSHRYPAAYYIAGYAVECALKACIAKHTKQHDFPERKLVNDSYTHDLMKLVDVARLADTLTAAHRTDKTFALNWDVVRDWSEGDRYNLGISKEDARELYRAITRRRTGIMTWLRNYW